MEVCSVCGSATCLQLLRKLIHLATNLIACAPEMREMLLKHEWDGAWDDNHSGCPECMSPEKIESQRDTGVHTSDCALGKLLDRIR